MKLDNIEKIIIPKIEEEGFEIEYVEFVKEGNNNIFRVVIDNPNGKVAIDDCEKISRKIEDDIDKNIDKEYVLEVSSAGLERQLKNIKLFEKYIGNDVYVKLYKKLDDKKEITGILKSVNDNNIVIESLEKEYIFNIKDIAVAHTIYDFDNAFKNKDNVNINKLKKF
jgi:ribosome maturation factor RimP